MSKLWTDESKKSAKTAICERLATGDSLTKICSETGFPDRRTCYDWLKADQDFAERYKEAGDAQADWFADRVVEIAESVRGGTKEEIMAARLLIDTLKWRAGQQSARWNPRMVVEHTGRTSVTFQFDLSGGQAKAVVHDPLPLLPEEVSGTCA